MKKFIIEIIALILQCIVFFIYPIYAIRLDPIGMVLTMIFMTFMLSLLLGLISNKKIKYLFPIISALLFLPTVYIFYNESAFVHSIWYFTISALGMFVAYSIRKFFHKLRKDDTIE